MGQDEVKIPLRFTQEEFDHMIRDILNGDYLLYLEIVNRILRSKYLEWEGYSVVKDNNLKADLRSFLKVRLMMEVRHIIFRDGCLITPDHFQAWVFKVGEKRAMDFMNYESRVRGDISGKKYEKWREELERKKPKSQTAEDADPSEKTRMYVSLVSVETGGYSEDDAEEKGIEIPFEDIGIKHVERSDEAGRILVQMNDLATKATAIKLYKVITWLLHLIALRHTKGDAAAAKVWMEEEFSDKTLDQIVAYIAENRNITDNVCVTEKQLARLCTRLEKTNKDGVRQGDARYGDYCMGDRPMRATISDWITWWNGWFVEKGVAV